MKKIKATILICLIAVSAAACTPPKSELTQLKLDCIRKNWVWVDQRSTRLACINPKDIDVVEALESADEAN